MTRKPKSTSTKLKGRTEKCHCGGEKSRGSKQCRSCHLKQNAWQTNIVNGQIRCPKCETWKDLVDFPTKGNGRGGRRYGYCKPCHAKYQRVQSLATTFNITPDEYDQIVAHQGGVCAICKRPPKEDGNRLSVDHAHTSGLVRGALCWLCNKALGYMKDDLNRLEAMVEYLTSPPAIVALGEERYGRKGRVTNRRRRKRKTTRKKKA